MPVEDIDVVGFENDYKKSEAETLPPDEPTLVKTLLVVFQVMAVATCLYCFLLGIELMATCFKVLGGSGAGNLFRDIPNGLAALMVGVLATVMVQSSSTSTSIVVALVSVGKLQVRPAVPIIMGANIGTTITNTIVSMGHSGDRLQLERAFAGATVHDMFNLMSVAVLFPIEELFHPIEAIASAVAEGLVGDACDGCDFASPLNEALEPVMELFIESNKNLIYSLSLGEPSPESGLVEVTEGCEEGNIGKASCGEQQYWCMDTTMSETWAKIHTHKFPRFSDSRWSCSEKGIGDAEDLCESCSAEGCGPVCVLSAAKFFDDEVKHGDTIKGGLFDFEKSQIGGTCALILSLVIMLGGLTGFVSVMRSLLATKARLLLEASTKVPGFVAILVGTGITIVVQSSSVTTSALTPLVGLGVLKLEKMFPLTLGANIGTCSTSVLAALATMKAEGMTIAFCHLTFNLLGILLIYPVPFIRRLPVLLASLAGMYASVYRWFPGAYIACVYVLLPLLALGVGFLFETSTPCGLTLVGFLLALVVGFGYWWSFMEGAYSFASKDQRLSTEFGRYLEESAIHQSEGKVDDLEGLDTEI